MARLFFFCLCALSLLNANAQEKSVILTNEALQVHADGSILVDEKKWQLIKKDDSTALYQRTREDRRDRVEVKKANGKLISAVGTYGIMGTAEKAAVWIDNAEAIQFKNGSREFATFCNGNEGCLSVTKEICDKYVKLLGVSSGSKVWDREAACVELEQAKSEIAMDVAQFTYSSQSEGNIKRVSGVEKVRDLTQSVFRDMGNSSTYTKVISGMCWKHYWSLEPKTANDAKEIKAQPKKTR